MKLRCVCGGDTFKAKKVTLVLRGVPCEITEDGPQYDDAEAEQSEGWDYNQESRVTCVACGKEYAIAHDGEANLWLEPASEDGYGNKREDFGSRVSEAGDRMYGSGQAVEVGTTAKGPFPLEDSLSRKRYFFGTMPFLR